MTKNRARVRATKELAQTAGLRHPDASYLADHRKLVLFENGPVVYDFSEGPLRFHCLGSVHLQMNEVQADAERKGWRIVTIDPAQPLPSVEELRREPSLVVVDIETAYADFALDPSVARLVEGGHPELNVVVGLHADDTLPSGFKGGRNRRWVLSSGRKLRLPDGTIHDFATGPLRYYGGKASGMSGAAFAVMKEAEEKGWRHERLLGKDFLAPERLLAYLRSDTFLVVLEHHAPGGPDPVTEAFEAALATGDYPDLNVLVTADDLEENPARGKNIRCARIKVPMWRQVADFDKVELAKARIAFALRYADMNATGADDGTALGAVAHDLDRFPTPEAAAIATAARSAVEPIRNGYTVAAHFKANHKDVLGTHLVEVIDSAWHAGRLAAGLRDAAATIEADLRIGLIV